MTTDHELVVYDFNLIGVQANQVQVKKYQFNIAVLTSAGITVGNNVLAVGCYSFKVFSNARTNFLRTSGSSSDVTRAEPST